MGPVERIIESVLWTISALLLVFMAYEVISVIASSPFGAHSIQVFGS